jgi:hypothetical protein
MKLLQERSGPKWPKWRRRPTHLERKKDKLSVARFRLPLPSQIVAVCRRELLAESNSRDEAIKPKEHTYDLTRQSSATAGGGELGYGVE